MAKNKFLLIMMFVLFAVGCTATSVQPVASTEALKHVCIQENEKVKVDDFVEVLQNGLTRHGVTSELFSNEKPGHCEYVLTYTALRSWDFAPYLSSADLKIEKNRALVASAHYHLRGKGGLALTKWQGTEKKMNPVIDELFENLA